MPPKSKTDNVRKRTQLDTGIYRDQWGIAATVKVGTLQREKRYPPDASLKTIKGWQDETRVGLRKLAPAGVRGTFAADAQRYLAAVAAMPTIKERTKHIELWAAEFGNRARHTIHTPEIDAVLSRWLLAPLAASTVNHRRTALLHLWNRLDGIDAPNPVRRAMKAKEPEPEQRALTYAQVEAILNALPDMGQALPGQARDDASKTKARLCVLAYTGLPAAQLKALRPADVNLTTRTMKVRARRKGKGSAGRELPLTATAVEAFERFDALDCWGTFSTSSVWKSFQRACVTAKVPGVRPYDLRHSFATMMYAETGDAKSVQELLMHSSQKTTARYTQGGVATRLRLAVQGFDKALPHSETAGSVGWQYRHKIKTPA